MKETILIGSVSSMPPLGTSGDSTHPTPFTRPPSHRTPSAGSGGQNPAPAPRRSDGAGPAPLRSAPPGPPSPAAAAVPEASLSLPPPSSCRRRLPPPPRTEIAAAMDDSGLIRRRRLQVRCSPGSKEGMGSVPWGGAEQNAENLHQGSAVAPLRTARGCSWPKSAVSASPGSADPAPQASPGYPRGCWRGCILARPLEDGLGGAWPRRSRRERGLKVLA